MSPATGARRRPQWIPYVVVGVIHLVLLAASVPLAAWTHILLMPALVLPALTVRPPLRYWVLGAIVLSWVGDAAPRLMQGQTQFLVMAGSFLLAQLVWVIALGDRWSLTLPARYPAATIPYLIAAVGIGAVTVPSAGALAPAVVLYAVALTSAAILASSMGTLGTWGGVLFMTSDTLLALRQFVPEFHFVGHDVVIMFTYIVAQGLLVTAASRIQRQPVED